jgi:hypothetical protein
MFISNTASNESLHQNAKFYSGTTINGIDTTFAPYVNMRLMKKLTTVEKWRIDNLQAYIETAKNIKKVNIIN